MRLGDLSAQEVLQKLSVDPPLGLAWDISMPSSLVEPPGQEIL